MPFAVGDKVVHPYHGVGVIVNLANRQFESDTVRAYYEISLANGTVWVPVDEPGLGLRKLTVKSELERCRQILQDPPTSLAKDRRKLRNQLVDHLKDGTVIAQCEVVRDLTALGRHKSLYSQMGEFRRVTLGVLCQEWAAVAEISPAEAALRINAYLNEGRLTNGG